MAIATFVENEEQHRRIAVLLQIATQFELPLSTTASIELGTFILLDELLLVVSPSWGRGSLLGKSPNLHRGREMAHERLVQDYFSGDASTYPPDKFRRRFRMSRRLFEKIVDGVVETDDYFRQKADALGHLGASPLQKVTAAIRLLAYGVSADYLDEWIRLGESTINKCLRRFVGAIQKKYGPTYLRSPTADDMKRMLSQNAARGFPGCLGSIDCFHWEWKNCPNAWTAQYKGKKGKGVVAEACCGPDLWIWHLYQGLPGSLNDINVLQRSPLLRSIYNRTLPQVDFSLRGNHYTYPYWLADGIYPEFSTFATAFSVPNNAVDQNFTHWQESIRKDIERAFGVLRARWGIIKTPGRCWSKEFLDMIVSCCVILHNMIVEDECEEFVGSNFEYDDFEGNIMHGNDMQIRVRNPETLTTPFATVLKRVAGVNDKEQHRRLRNDLKHHLFENFPHYKDTH